MPLKKVRQQLFCRLGVGITSSAEDQRWETSWEDRSRQCSLALWSRQLWLIL